MRTMKLLLALLAAALCMAAVVPSAQAHGYGRGNGYWGGPTVRFYFGGPAWWGPRPYYYYYPPPVYAYPVPPVIVPPPAPPVYIERGQEETPQQPEAQALKQWWFYCAAAKGYYPYVRECPGGWEQVPALPPGPTR